MRAGAGEGALEGALAYFFPSEVLQLAQLAQATGRLEFTRGDERVDLFLDHGRPVFARTTGLAVRVGEVLVHRRLVTPAQLESALEAQRRAPGRRVGTLLAETGAVGADDVREAVHEVLRRIVWGVLMWREGRFRFLPGSVAVGEDIQPDLDVDRLILDGLRLADQERAARTGEV